MRAGYETAVMNTDETAATGTRCVKALAKPIKGGDAVYVYRKTYYTPQDFHDSRYDPCFSPLIYPGQTLYASVCVPEYSQDTFVCLYVRDAHSGKVYESERVAVEKGKWYDLKLEIPAMEGALLDEMGVCAHVLGEHMQVFDYVILVDDLYADGCPDYTLDFSKEHEEFWNGLHREISQMTKLKGLMYLYDGQFNLSCSDFAEAYTGRHDWKDYTAEFTFTPVTGANHMVNVRVQGAIRSYAFGLLPDGKAALLKNDNGYTVIAEAPFAWELNKEYTVKVTAQGNCLKAEIGDVVLEACDTERPYLLGAVGVSMVKGTHDKCRKIKVGPVK